MPKPYYLRNYETTQENVGHILFGNVTRLKVGMWVVQKELDVPFTIKNVAEGTSLQSSSIGKHLITFTELDMLDRHEDRSDGFLAYTRLKHDVWAVYEAASKINFSK